ncbi:EamA family transporter [Diaphorobacter aerolatus]|uniref:DMT family transporter n=1 Tax=Diaphorobacter aerolatus TaxID=1288495 RepID=A0A7H0GME0_9BURK|nr:DMT family transporter [Diaphorobacter aerolatus]QNP49456.1 DMT family transporter [Diaphorobacter aerolatus]
MSHDSLLQRLLPSLAVLGSVTSLCVGTSFAKHLFPVIGAQGTTALRVGFSALLLLAIWRPWRFGPTRANIRQIVIFGAVLGLMNLLFYMAIKRLPFGVTVAIEFIGPLSVAVWTSRRPLDLVWLGLAVVGLFLLLILPLFGAQVGTLDPVGLAYAIAASVCWAGYIVLGKRTGHMHGGMVVSLGLLSAAFVVVPFGIAEAGAKLLTPSLLIYGLVVAAVSSAIPYSLEMFALKRLSHSAFSTMLATEPAVAALAGMLLLHENLTLTQWSAIGIIMCAAMGSALTARPEPVKTTENKPAHHKPAAAT